MNAFLGRQHYERAKAFRGYRNGYHLPRGVTVGLGPVEMRLPRVAKAPPDVTLQRFESQLVRRYERASQTTQRLFARLHLEGLATGDFEPVFRELVEETTALSANAVVRLKERWGEEYGAWRRRPLWEHQYACGCYLPGCGNGEGEDGTSVCPGGQGGWRKGTPRHGAWLQREHRELG